MLPVPSKGGGSESEDEMEVNYASVVLCNLAQSITHEWIIDSGATHHMTGSLEHKGDRIKNEAKDQPPNWTNINCIVSHTGEVRLENNVKLRNVMYIPAFKHNLMSVPKLTEQGRQS